MSHQDAIRRAFHAAATEYEAHAIHQREVCRRLAQLVETHQPDAGGLMLDAGCGTGYFGQWARQHHPDWRIIGVDIAEAMCQQAAPHYAGVVIASIEQPFIKSSTLSFIFSSLCLQWILNLDQTFILFNNALKSHGLLAISCYGDGCLRELQDCFSALDTFDHHIHFPTEKDITNSVRRAGFQILHYANETTIREDASLRDLLHYLKRIGANQLPAANRRRSLMTPRQFATLEREYRVRFGADFPSSWPVHYLIAQKP